MNIKIKGEKIGKNQQTKKIENFHGFENEVFKQSKIFEVSIFWR